MKSLSAGLAGLVVAYTLAGCETIIEIDPPGYDGELAVISYFNHDSTWSARITQTVPVGGNVTIGQPFLETAKVTVWDGSELIDELLYDGHGTGWYQSPAKLRPRIGVPYTMKVEAEGFAPTRATSAIPRIPRLTRAYHERISESRYDVHFRLTDPPVNNYYSFSAYIGAPLISSDGGHTEYILEMLWMIRPDHLWHCSYVYAADPLPDIEEEDTLCRTGIMTDRLYNGQPLDMTVPIVLDPDQQWEAPILIFMIHSLSHSFFEYKRTLQLDELSNPFSEPVQIYSNFEGARGVFAGFSTNYLVFNLAVVG